MSGDLRVTGCPGGYVVAGELQQAAVKEYDGEKGVRGKAVNSLGHLELNPLEDGLRDRRRTVDDKEDSIGRKTLSEEVESELAALVRGAPEWVHRRVPPASWKGCRGRQSAVEKAFEKIEGVRDRELTVVVHIRGVLAGDRVPLSREEKV